MPIEIHSAIFTLLATILVGAGLYKQYDISKTSLLLFITASPVINLFSNHMIPDFLSITVFTVLLILFLRYILKKKLVASVIVAIITTFIYTITFSTYIVIANLWGGEEYWTEGYLTTLYAMIFLNSVCALVVWFYYKYRNVQNITDKTLSVIDATEFIQLKPKTFGTLYVMVSIIDTIFIAICMGMELEKCNFDFGLGCMFVVIMYSLLMILTLTMMQGLVKNEMKLTSKEDEVEKLKGYTETIEDLVDEMQKSRHDYKNMILSIQDFVAEKKFDELEEYFRTEIIKSENIEKVSKNIYLATKQIKVLPLKSIINAKLNEAISLGIKVEITIFSEINPTSVSAIDLCRIMGNFLDNSIDAAQESKNKVISLVMLKNDNQISITLCNSFSGEIDLSAIWKRGYSSKGKGRGLGLAIVKKIVEKEHTNILLNTEIKNDLFVQDITIIE